MELDPGTWVVHRCVVDTPFGSWTDGPERRAFLLPASSFADEVERDLLELEDLGLTALTDGSAAG